MADRRGQIRQVACLHNTAFSIQLEGKGSRKDLWQALTLYTMHARCSDEPANRHHDLPSAASLNTSISVQNVIHVLLSFYAGTAKLRNAIASYSFHPCKKNRKDEVKSSCYASLHVCIRKLRRRQSFQRFTLLQNTRISTDT